MLYIIKVPIKITLNCKCNSNMDILQIMPVNMVNALRLQINASGKQLERNTPWNMSPEGELNLNLSSAFSQSVTYQTSLSLEQY